MKKYYPKVSLTFLLAFVFTVSAFSQNKQSVWTKVLKSQIESNDLVFRKSAPTKADFYQLDITQLKQELQNAPQRGTDLYNSNVVVSFPNVDGVFENFRVYEASVLANELQVQYPNIRSYVGQSIDNPETLIRFSLTPQGLHTMTLSSKTGTQFIDPYARDSNSYMVYSKRNLPFGDRDIICEFEDDGIIAEDMDIDVTAERNANDGQMREFRLALACTVEYANFHWTAAGLTGADSVADRKDAVLAAMVVTMTRVNGLYEKELSITMTIIANNLDIINITTDTYTNDNGGVMLGQNQSAIDSAIGNSNYDIGHVFSTGGGGIAQLNSPCVTGSKARGVTGLPNPVGDGFDIDFVCHEMGHQFGSPHTFNGSTGNCAGGNRSGSDAYEPGSGSTIMAYAGICTPQNVQNSSDDYFHQRSLQLIWANVNSGNSQCGDEMATGNTAPTANAGANYNIPKSTPYKLTASSTDVESTDTHTYTWEQWDLGPAGLPTETAATAPLVRSFEGTTNPTRYIPNLPDLLDSPGSTDWEKLSSIGRNINFQVTVRDNDPRGGQTATDNMRATTISAAGPFMVTSQNTDQIVWTPGETETITWDVAGTTGNGIDAANVNILLSTSQNPDADFDTVIVASVPNNGSYDIVVPDVSAPYCRIMVEAADNIFFNINEKFFAIGNYVYVPGDVCEDYFFNANLLLDENDMTFSGFTLNVGDSRTISDLDISLDVTTTNNAEIFTAVRGPWQGAADPLTFLARGTCDGATDLILTFDDEGVATDCGDTASNDNVLPFDPLSFADGEDSQGDWVLFIGDVIVDGNRATWNNATLTICETGGFVPILSTDDFEFDDNFSVYPNPNNGQFTIKLKSNSGSDINVEVFDIRGRSILNKSYTNNGDFNQTISLDNAQSGMYLLNINDGDKKLTKKIIVN
jgi:hypothetical protein